MRAVRGVILLATAFVALGALLAVAGAWGVELLNKQPQRTIMIMTEAPGSPYSGWAVDVPGDWPAKPMSTSFIGQGGTIDPVPPGRVRGAERLRVRQGMYHGVASSPAGVAFLGDDPTYVVEWIETGWPMRTMGRRGDDDSTPAPRGGLAKVWRAGVSIGGGRALPLRPVWPGFLLVTLAGAAVAALPWLAWRGARAAVASIRAGRGGCPACGYDWGELGACPECGRARAAASA
ncbi:MAG TPA: hypothetical protein VFF69_07275 [Phycisphaerales bacterium]|nr:hypothetical protein [Phycisphaerales bacterium]